MKSYHSILLLLILAACGSNVTPPPSNLNDACLIKSERPKWFNAMHGTQEKWGVPVSVQMATIYQESKFKGEARTPLSFKLGVIPMGRKSSAFGYSQAIDSTWKWYIRETGNRSAKRNDFEDAVDFMGWYMDQSTQKLNIPKTNARKQYLAYHDGHTGYRRGSYRRKGWLVRISKEVQARAKMYGTQLTECSKDG
ncbi:MAG: hypothetical protein ACI9ZD_001848 [Paracoccaceae bacterium]|jgi:hypothetical protein